MVEQLYAHTGNGSKPTTLVTVTYADRLVYLQELLFRAFEVEGVWRAIVVSNASRSDLALLEQQWGERLHIVRLDKNTGSANGYSVGIKTALDTGADYIWLMDDDNAPKPGALQLLHERLTKLTSDLGAANSAVMGFRPDHQADIAAGMNAKSAYPLRSSFFGFHYKRLVAKVWRRYIRRAANMAPSAKLVESAQVPYAPYGGLLASKELFERIGLPKREFVLYADDTEYTCRITIGGGVIELVTDAILEDLEGSWNIKGKYGNSIVAWLQGGSDFRAFYASRNQAWFDSHVWISSRLEYEINTFVYTGLLKYYAWRTGNSRRYNLLRRAISDGQNSKLGTDAQFPLT